MSQSETIEQKNGENPVQQEEANKEAVQPAQKVEEKDTLNQDKPQPNETYKNEDNKPPSQISLENNTGINKSDKAISKKGLSQSSLTTRSKELPPLVGRDSDRVTNGSSSNRNELSLGKVFGDVKRSKRQADIEAAILHGRIQLLKQEQENSKKKIFQTKKQTLEYYLLKKSNEDQSTQRAKNKGNEEDYMKQLQQENERLRQLSKESLDQVKSSQLQLHRENFLNIKRQQELNDKRIKEISERHLEMNQRKKLMVQQQELKSSMHVIEYKNKQTERYLENYKRWIEQTEDSKQKRQQEISEMEQIEINLIKKLQATQQLQRKAFEELQGIITMKSDEFHSEFQPILHRKKVSRLISTITESSIHQEKEEKNLSHVQSAGQISLKGGSQLGEQEANTSTIKAESKTDESQNKKDSLLPYKTKTTKPKKLKAPKIPEVDFIF